MKQHMMTHKLRDVPQHMFSKKMEPQRNKSPDSRDAPSLRVKSEAELNPRSATTPEQRFEAREKSLPPHLQAQVCTHFYAFFPHLPFNIKKKKKSGKIQLCPLECECT